MPAWLAAAVPAITSLAGDLFSSGGQSATNQTNMQIAQMNNTFNAQQAALNRGFQQNMLGQTESWNAMMSDTAVQRRSQDLAAAGLNPQLAVGNPASSPMIGPPGGATASSAGLPQISNPLAALGQLGSQTAQALQTQSQISLQSAQAQQAQQQARYIHSQTPTSKPGDSEDGDLPEINVDPMGNHLLGDATLAQIQANTSLQKEQKQQVVANVSNIEASTRLTDKQTQGQQISNMIQGQDYKILVATRDALIQKAIAQANIEQKGSQMADKDWDIMSGKYGTAIMTINKALPALNTAISAAGAARGLGGVTNARVTQSPNWGGDTSDDWKNFHLPMQE